MARSTLRRENADTPQVRCDHCGRWAYLEETEYKTYREARGADGYVCRLCSRDDALAVKLSALEAETEKLRGVVAQLQVQILSLTTTTGRNAEFGAAVNEACSGRRGLEHETGQSTQVHPNLEAASPRVTESTPELDTPDVCARRDQHNTSLGEQAKLESPDSPGRESLEPAPEDPVISLDMVSHGLGDNSAQEAEISAVHVEEVGGAAENEGAQSTEDGRHSCTDAPNAALTLQSKERKELPSQKEKVRGRRGDNQRESTFSTTPRSIPGHREAAQQDIHLEQHVSRPTVQGRMPTRSGGNWVFPARSARREVLIVGDANVGKMATAILEAMDSPGAVGLLYGRKATTAQAFKYIASYERRAKSIPRRYVVHVGLVDVLRRTPDEIVHSLNASSANGVDDIVVCSIPEVATKGEEVRAAILLANARIRKWCRRTRRRFIDLSRGWQDTMLEKDGLYSLEGASFVAAKIAQATLPFLGERWQNHQRKPVELRYVTPPVQQAPNNGTLGLLSASITAAQSVPPQSLAQMTPLLQFSQPTLAPQEGVPWRPTIGMLPMQPLQGPPPPESMMPAVQAPMAFWRAQPSVPVRNSGLEEVNQSAIEAMRTANKPAGAAISGAPPPMPPPPPFHRPAQSPRVSPHLPMAHPIPPPWSDGHHQMLPRQSPSTVLATPPQGPHSVHTVPTWGPIRPPVWNPQSDMPAIYSAVGDMVRHHLMLAGRSVQ